MRRFSARTAGFGVSVAAIALVAVACSSNSPTASTGTTPPAPAATTAAPTTAAPPASSGSTGSSSVALKTASGSAGIWLTDQAGKTLYIYTKDTGTTSTCYGGCATAWPPLTATGSVTVTGQFTDQSLVGSTKRTDGSTQVTYGGHPLYYYQADSAAGETKGQGVGGVWFILGPKANIMK
jgi:predicted lipoprotein with Yx(FWY)xxD motif